MSIKLADYNAVCVNISSGKDSQQTLQNICEQAYREGVLHRVSAVYADTGAELTGSMPHCRYLTNYYQVPNHPLPEKIRLRGRWPSAKCRYCTSDCKVAPIAKYIRNKYIFKEECRILMVSGERREESPHRKTLPEFEVDTNLTAGYRKVFRYRPILDMTKKEVWSSIYASKLRWHPAYSKGNDRVSCAICIFANATDIRNGAEDRPDLAEEFLKFEQESNHTFRYRQTLASILCQRNTPPGAWPGGMQRRNVARRKAKYP